MKVVVASGKRKTAIARATIRQGMGRIRINKVPLEHLMPPLAREIIEEPLYLATEDIIKKVDINVNVRGGGVISQAEAARMAIAKGLVEFTKSMDLRNRFIEYDRTMIASDPRRREPKKFGGPGARARKQKSYR